jgi:DNA-binding response OmpR family regulator
MSASVIPLAKARTPNPVRPLVLICDDEDLVLDILDHHLSKEGYEVVRAQDGSAALACIAERLPAAVILAIMLPDMCGIEALRRIRETPDRRHVPVMILTYRDAEGDVVEALKLGASDYLTKPFMIGEVLERVSKLITPFEHPLESLLEDLAA